MDVPQRDLALDSQCLTYLVQALDNLVEPTGDEAEEKKALVRCFLYCDSWLFLTPTAGEEIAAIPDSQNRKRHESWSSSHFGAVHLPEPEQNTRISARATFFGQFHNGANDCCILAEAEELGALAVLSYDKKFVARLQPHSRIKVIWPSEFWLSLGIAPGTHPVLVPTIGNPLAEQNWWRV